MCHAVRFRMGTAASIQFMNPGPDFCKLAQGLELNSGRTLAGGALSAPEQFEFRLANTVTVAEIPVCNYFVGANQPLTSRTAL